MASTVNRSWATQSSSTRWRIYLLPLLMAMLVINSGPRPASGSLEFDYYSGKCENLEHTIEEALQIAYSVDQRIAASLLRLHFHDCFVNGCDGSVLLKDNGSFIGEQNAFPNANSLRGFDVIDNIKTLVEDLCPDTVSCADILALVARDSVVITGGPTWPVLLGRYDSLTASQAAANADLPAPFFNVNSLTSAFAAVDLSQEDMVALSGAHTIGKAHCAAINVPGNSRLYDWSENSDLTSGTSKADPNMDPNFLASIQGACPQGGDSSVLNNLDLLTPTVFDTTYYQNILGEKGFLNSDQALFYQNNATKNLVRTYANNKFIWFVDFVFAIIKMSAINPKTAANGQIRKNCGFINSS